MDLMKVVVIQRKLPGFQTVVCAVRKIPTDIDSTKSYAQSVLADYKRTLIQDHPEFQGAVFDYSIHTVGF